jgi:hypothetical protein
MNRNMCEMKTNFRDNGSSKAPKMASSMNSPPSSQADSTEWDTSQHTSETTAETPFSSFDNFEDDTSAKNFDSAGKSKKIQAQTKSKEKYSIDNGLNLMTSIRAKEPG